MRDAVARGRHHAPRVGRDACSLELLVGRVAPCPGEPCPFWRAEDGCVMDESTAELAGRPDVARLLLAVRDRLLAQDDAA